MSRDPEGRLDVHALLGDLGPEFESFGLGRCLRQGDTRFDHAMNWKLAIGTFGETCHFTTLHRDTLANDFYGNAQMYDTHRRNEPALHHYHNTHRETLGMPPLETVSADA